MYRSILFSVFMLSSAFCWSQVPVDSTRRDSVSQQLKDSMKSELAQVVITAKKPLLVQELDKTVVNVESMIGSASSNVLEVLQKTPGVSVSVNGDISLNGKAGVMVMINNRPTYLSGQALANYLKALPGGSVDKFELMDQPSAKYDAQGSAVINIKLKRNRISGLTGNLSTGFTQGTYGRNNHSLNLNYQHNTVSLFLNLGNNNETNYNTETNDRLFYSAGRELQSRVLLDNKLTTVSHGLLINTGAEFAPDSNTTVGVSVTVNNSFQRGESVTMNDMFNSLNTSDSSGTTQTDAREIRRNLGLGANASRKFPKTRGELSADLNYLHYPGLSYQTTNTLFYDKNGANTNEDGLYYNLPSDLDIYVAKVDYTQPLGSTGNLEAGLKSSVIRNHDLSQQYDVTEGEKTFNDIRSSDFSYREQIHAGYVNVRRTWKQFSLLAGMRVENTSATGFQAGNSSQPSTRFTKRYTDYFPGLYLNYKLDTMGKNAFTVSFSRRLNRPNYQKLNPFQTFIDQYSYNTGNPMLTPQYQSRIELKYQHKQYLTIGLSYNDFTDVILSTTRQEGQIFFSHPENIGRGRMILLNTNLSLSPARWWTLNYTLRLSRIGLDGRVNDAPLHVWTSIARFEWFNSFSFGNQWSAELSAYYASADLDAQTITSGMFRAQAAVQKKFWDSKASIRLSVDDIFHSWVYHNRSVALADAEFFRTTRFDSRRFGLAFTYAFGKSSSGKKRTSRENATDDEKGRVN